MLLMNKFENNFSKIKRYFDTLNLNKNHFMNSNDICTPMDCVKEMVDSIPEKFWRKKDLKVLDGCVGNGNFHSYIATKTPLKNLYFNEINKKRVANLYKYFGKNINLTTKDFLIFPEEEKFDLVVSNPPYAKFTAEGKRASKNHNISRDFIRKALKITKDGGYILFIVPNNWMSFADRNDLPHLLSKYKFIELDIHGAKKYFPKVGSSFTWFLLKKDLNDGKHKTIVHNNYFKKDLVKVNIRKGSSFLPLYYSSVVKSILEKTIYNNIEKYNVETTSFLHHYTKKHLLNKHKTDTYKYPVIHTPSQVVYSKIKHKWQEGYKVFLPLTNQFYPFIKKNFGATQSIAFIRCASKQEATEIKKDLEQPLYKFIVAITRYGNFNNQRILQNLPKYNKIKLSKKEQDLIIKFNELYYRNKEAKFACSELEGACLNNIKTGEKNE